MRVAAYVCRGECAFRRHRITMVAS
jgi:hypothetical protein